MPDYDDAGFDNPENVVGADSMAAMVDILVASVNGLEQASSAAYIEDAD